jgi:hypothetical protein
VHIGDLATWSTQLAAASEPVMAVLGLDGSPAELERSLNANFSALFDDASHCVVLISCTGGAAGSNRTGVDDRLYESAAAQALPGIPA